MVDVSGNYVSYVFGKRSSTSFQLSIGGQGALVSSRINTCDNCGYRYRCYIIMEAFFPLDFCLTFVCVIPDVENNPISGQIDDTSL